MSHPGVNAKEAARAPERRGASPSAPDDGSGRIFEDPAVRILDYGLPLNVVSAAGQGGVRDLELGYLSPEQLAGGPLEPAGSSAGVKGAAG